MTPHQLPVPDALTRLIRIQAGVISYRQACSLLSRATVDSLRRRGLWVPVARGIISTSPQLTWEGKLWAGVLAGGPQCAVGGWAALVLHGLTDEQREPIRVFAPSTIRRRVPGVAFVHSARPGRGEPPRTPVSEALVDAWSEVSRGDFEIILGRALQRRRTSPDQLEEALRKAPTLAGRAELRAILGLGVDGVHSPLESRYVRDVERAHGLPRAERQVRLPGGVADGWYRELAVALELDGRRYHEDRLRDRGRDNLNSAHGIVTLRFGWIEVTQDPCAVAAQVARVLAARGWPGAARSCPRCRSALTSAAG